MIAEVTHYMMNPTHVNKTSGTIKTEDVYYLEAYDKYCFIHYTSGRRTLVSKNLKHVLMIGHFTHFKRTHRKYAVNPEYVKRIKNDKTELLLANDQTITISRARKKAVWTWFSQLKNSFN